MYRIVQVFVVLKNARLCMEWLTQLSSYKEMAIRALELKFNRLFLLAEKFDQLHVL